VERDKDEDRRGVFPGIEAGVDAELPDGVPWVLFAIIIARVFFQRCNPDHIPRRLRGWRICGKAQTVSGRSFGTLTASSRCRRFGIIAIPKTVPRNNSGKRVVIRGRLDHKFPLFAMHLPRPIACLVVAAALCLTRPTRAADPVLAGVGAAMQDMVAKDEIAGAVTIVVTKDKLLHLASTGMADIASKRAMTPDALFWIASMTKPITGTAVLMLQDEGKLNVADPVAKYLPEFANLKTPSGKPANLTITQLLTHTSGLGEAGGEGAKNARTLADLVPLWLATPMQYEPGAKWKYTQSGINAAARIVEVVSGMTFDAFVQKRLFDPLGMKDTTFYPSDAQRARLATAYAKNKDGTLEAVPPRADFGTRGQPPRGNGGLYSTAPDYARFCQMLLGGGTLDGRRILSADAMKFLSTPQTGDLPTGFFQNDTFGQRGKNYGWGIGTSILRTPHEGVAAMLSPGTFGHGGAWGTQAWCDPVRGVAFVMMVQHANFPNSDASIVRGAFQQAAADALGGK
jgi:CubicO group peptidase (beta-lactamase class C family)